MHNSERQVEPKLDKIPRRKLLKLGWAVPVVLAINPPKNLFAVRSGICPTSSNCDPD